MISIKTVIKHQSSKICVLSNDFNDGRSVQSEVKVEREFQRVGAVTE